MPINGSGSDFPAALDVWGEEHDNNVCEVVRASDLNAMAHAVFALEKHTLSVLQMGRTDAPTHHSSFRPTILCKNFEVEVTGSPAEIKTVAISGPMFTTEEKNLFGGSPLGTSGSIHTTARLKEVVGSNSGRVLVGLHGAISDLTGDSGVTVGISPLRDSAGDTNFKVAAGFYIVSFMILRT